MSSANSPCAACKCLRRKCTQECVFAPYFPPDDPQKFTNVHKVFGASNVSKILNDLNVGQREEAVNSLAYEAESRLKDPVYGCVALISVLQQRLKQVHLDLDNAKKKLAAYIGPSAMLPILNHPAFVQQHYQVMPYNVQPMTGIPHGAHQQHQQQQQQFLEAQQLAAARQQEMMRSYELQQQQNDLFKFNGGFDEAGGGPVTATGFNQIAGGGMQQQQPNYHQIQQQEQSHHVHLQQQQDLLLQHQQQQNVTTNHPLQVQRAKSEELERSIGL